jgi:putative membrane protein
MDRRYALGSLAVLSVLPARLATAQTTSQNGPSPTESKQMLDTLATGTVALETSRIAMSKASNAAVKRFAQFEVAEQETIAMVLKGRGNLGGNPPPPVDAKGKAMIEALQAAKAGPEFDRSYIEEQVEGHQRLLQIQEAYLSAGKDEAHRGIVMLARGQIKEHLANLDMIHGALRG